MKLTIDQPVWYIGADAQPGSVASREDVVHDGNATLVDIRFGNAISRFPAEDVIPAIHDTLCESDALSIGHTPCACRDRAIATRNTAAASDRDREALRIRDITAMVDPR